MADGIPILIDVQQRSDAWRQARAGKATASAIDAVLANGRGGKEATTRVNYRAQMIAEILSGRPCDDGYLSRPMQWGIEQEPYARAAYEVAREISVEEIGLVLHPKIDGFACSPDGLIGDDGMLQIKCPNTATHIAYLLSGEVPGEYQAELLAGLACTGRAWCDFVSFDPRLPANQQLFVKRFYRDEARIGEIERAVEQFLAEVRDTLARLAGRDRLEDQLIENLKAAPPAPAEPEAPPAAADDPKPRRRARKGAKVDAAPGRPTWDDVDDRGERRFANYLEYELAKDAWLRTEILGEFRKIIDQARG